MNHMKKIRVCNSRSCSAFGARRVMDGLEEQTGVHAGEHNDRYDLDYCGCLGWCSNSPNVEVDDERILFEVEPSTILARIEKGENDEEHYMKSPILIDDAFLEDL